mmetsp:Transcript_111012/g.358353  ORF Transcript_111012/g.358353 Transcript_111012/m.358353 type:complete len:249 (+) Transcript_111012:384-1130(+)
MEEEDDVLRAGHDAHAGDPVEAVGLLLTRLGGFGTFGLHFRQFQRVGPLNGARLPVRQPADGPAARSSGLAVLAEDQDPAPWHERQALRAAVPPVARAPAELRPDAGDVAKVLVGAAAAQQGGSANFDLHAVAICGRQELVPPHDVSVLNPYERVLGPLNVKRLQIAREVVVFNDVAKAVAQHPDAGVLHTHWQYVLPRAVLSVRYVHDEEAAGAVLAVLVLGRHAGGGLRGLGVADQQHAGSLQECP